jgi:hypothetical protein
MKQVADIYGYCVAVGTTYQPLIVMLSQAHLGLSSVMHVHQISAESFLGVCND